MSLVLWCVGGGEQTHCRSRNHSSNCPKYRKNAEKCTFLWFDWLVSENCSDNGTKFRVPSGFGHLEKFLFAPTFDFEVPVKLFFQILKVM